ncbi:MULTISPECIES: tRNA lysidine(34) synthetase TilS [Proteus]|uniref:tRNA lysidine(34) synthetase TilS n=1 Tax=Proteus TaxID=583 RepID=UPI0013788E40|nr:MULTISPECIES: tRNA lysidine(34) synthetase TilS [Proteus]MCX2588161.1 tRNA lysidine(34) synthetase TilS [Proteus penneri]NBL76702.1 tRNA lysidine(34) synthetase TilS [Proteus sp. G2672]NBM58980.1 tRNA lysidine(34) synthetase TilS [Proteus sp. G2667]NBM90920.1 tRNA lysidine(34) synthetase TilS [Proteus sp. G2658]
MKQEYGLLLKEIKQQIDPFTKILVGFSGGVDSTVLLQGLVRLRDEFQLPLELTAIYIHHGLNIKADDWLAHCKQCCQQWRVNFISEKVNVDPKEGGLENGAREARYQAFRRYLQPQQVLVTAQHQDDQAETFLLALKRGSGPAGLSSMPAKMMFENSYLLRPLLNITREQIEFYATEQELDWIEDESNQDDSYDRNFLRLRVMPLLTQRWPHFSQSVTRSAALCGEQEALLDELLEPELNALMDSEHSLDIKQLALCSVIKRNALLRRWFAQHNKAMPSRQQILRLWQEVALAKADAEPKLQFYQDEVRRYKQRLYLVPIIDEPINKIIEWPLTQSLSLPSGLGVLSLTTATGKNTVRAPSKDEKVTVRFGLTQASLRIVGREHARHSKKIWQELDVAPWRRTRIPLIYYNDTLIAAIDTFVTFEGKATSEHAITIEWRKAYE